MSRKIDTFFYGENTDNLVIGDIYSRVKELYFGIGKTIVDIYKDEIISLAPAGYDDKAINFVSQGIERFLIFGELGAIAGAFINDVDLMRSVNDKKYIVTTNTGEELDLFLVRKDLLFQEGINSERLGLSLLSECSREIKRYNLILDSTTIAIKSKSIDVIKGEISPFNLADGVKAIQERISEINKIKGFFSTLFLKTDEEFVTHDKNLSNIDKAIEKVELALCAVSKIPYFRLFGKVSSSQRYSGVEEKKAFQKALAPLVSVSNKILKYYCDINKLDFEDIRVPTLDIEQEEVIGKSLENLMLLSEVYDITNEEKKSYLKSRGII
jgi:hypothetical protein